VNSSLHARQPEQSAADAPAPTYASSSISGWRYFRVIVLALLIAPFCTYWASDQIVDRIFSLMVPPVMITFALVLINKLLQKYAPRFAFLEGELIVFYIMQSVICVMSSEWMDMINNYIVTYAIRAQNDPTIQNHILPYLSKYLFFTNDKQLRDIEMGGFSFDYTLQHLGMWWRPILSWTFIVFIVCFSMLCINSLMRDQWTRREKLAFPIIQLPMAMMEGGGRSPFWRNRYMWGGFIVMAILDMLNGFHYLYPSLPSINLRFIGDVSQWLPNPPWNAIGWTPIGLFPFISALGVFMPTDLLFSCIFFFFFRKMELVTIAAFGVQQGEGGGGGLVPGPPYLSEQSWGAFIGLFLSALFVSRGYLKEVWEEIVKGTRRKGELSHRIVFVGLLLSMIGLGWVGVSIGLPFLLVIGYLCLYLVFAIAVTRLRAQLGAPSHEMAFMGPNQMIVDFAGTQNLSEATITHVVTTFYFMNRIHRDDPMPSQLESMKMGETSGVNQMLIFFVIVGATIIGTILAHITRIYLNYHLGYGTWGGGAGFGAGTVSTISSLLNNRRPANPVAISAVLAGLLVVIALDFIRFRYSGFPLHPAGYALAMNFGLDYYWTGLLAVLIIKVFVTHYYGLKGYDKMRNVALGVILGEFVVETIWAVMAMYTGHSTYSISINDRLWGL
jgi:hypothetical protein